MRSFLITSVLVVVTAVAFFALGLHYRPVTLPAGTPVTIWQTDCKSIPAEPGETLEKL